MSLAADAAVFEQRDEPGLAPSIALALAVHLALGMALFLGVRWQSKPPETVAVELWLPPPAPVAPPLPAVEPKPEPRPEPSPEPAADKPEIALKAPPKAKPEPEKKKPEPAKPKAPTEKKEKAEPPKAKPEAAKAPPREDPFKREMLEQLAREQSALKVDQERSRVLGELAASSNAKGTAEWSSKVRAKVRGNVVPPPDLKGNPEAVFDVVQLPTGEVLSVKLKRSSGTPALDEAIERAILKSSPLPRPERSELFQRSFELRYRPLE